MKASCAELQRLGIVTRPCCPVCHGRATFESIEVEGAVRLVCCNALSECLAVGRVTPSLLLRLDRAADPLGIFDEGEEIQGEEDLDVLEPAALAEIDDRQALLVGERRDEKAKLLGDGHVGCGGPVGCGGLHRTKRIMAG
jgi:hypothetical protein